MPFGNVLAVICNRANIMKVLQLRSLSTKHTILQCSKLKICHPKSPKVARRLLATVPSSGPNLQVTGQCNAETDETIPRHIALSPSIRLANTTVEELRQEFLNFFRQHQHTVVAPASVFPKIQEGSYFVNAGMNQFKPLFLGQTNDASSVQFSRLRRATNSQPCIRVGGRHDDLNDVGYDRQHHTMFEMLGSWSFGDYYKEEACRLMWNFVTKVLGLPTNALYVTYFGGCHKLGLDPDDETRDIWLKLGVMDQKLLPFGMEHNFWRAGHASGAGLCGPSTELHVDFHALRGDEGLRCARCLINTPNPQVMELWNSVFISHRIQAGEHGLVTRDALVPLPKRFVDTGMGLERLACVMQGVTSTYDTDAFIPLLDFVRARATTSTWTPPPYGGEFIPFCRQTPVDPDARAAQDEEAAAVASNSSSVRSFSTLFRQLMAPKRASRPSCPYRNCEEKAGERTQLYHHHHHHASSARGGVLDEAASTSKEDDDLVDRWHRDTAYRLMVDHSRALAYALADGLLPGRQGLALKLRQLIHRAARASILTGLDPMLKSSSVLGSLVAEVARNDRLAMPSSVPELQGPSARKPSRLSYEEMEALVTKEVLAFVPRLESIEEAFHQCLDENPDATRLSSDQVQGLMAGKYGVPVSWDMLCAQSHWFGLCVPEAGPLNQKGSSANHNPVPSSSHSSSPSRTTASKQTVDNRPGFGQPFQMARQLHVADIPSTDDSSKYHCLRTSTQSDSAVSYVVPEFRAHLLGVFIASPSHDEPTLFTPTGDVTAIMDTIAMNPVSHMGLVFDRTNFFSPAGGQDSDKGEIHTSSSDLVFHVDHVQGVPDPNHSDRLWIVHWCIINLPSKDASVLSAFRFDQPYTMQVDSERRLQLMRHHTGQHLFAWAIEHLLRPRVTNPVAQDFSELARHGGAVHPDRFVVNTALLDSQFNVAVDLDAVSVVQELETFCRSAIEQKLCVRRIQSNWTSIAQNPNVRRFPWVNYPDVVTAVCIGDVLLSDPKRNTDPAASAELCSGTHVENTADLVDLIVTSVRGRKQSVKQFTGIVGETARQAREHGDRLLADALAREARVSSNPSELPEHIEWLETVLTKPSDFQPTLPFTVRESLQACLLRMRTQRNLGGRHTANDVDRITHQLLQSLAKDGAPIVHMAPLPSCRPTTVAEVISKVKPNQTTVVCVNKQAVCYFPTVSHTSEGLSALSLAHHIAQRLSETTPSLFPSGSVKARPIRSAEIDSSILLQLASLQLTAVNSSTTNDFSWTDSALREALEHVIQELLSERTIKSSEKGFGSHLCE